VTFTHASASPDDTEVVLTGDGSRTLRLPGGEGYKSLAGALTEARYVYLEASGAADRLRAGSSTRVLEIGFGTGLLFLVTAALAEETGATLEYVGIEGAPPAPELLAQLDYAALLAPSPLPEALLEWRRTLGAAPAAGRHDLKLGSTRLSLLVGDARQVEVEGEFHAVYHDAFSPRTNPRLWEPDFLSALAARLLPGGRLVSFTVAGSVRRALIAAGLEVSKRPSPPGGKREVLVAARPG